MMDAPTTPAKFNESFERCVDNPVFLDHFYSIFTSSSDEVKLMFKNTDMESQKLMLIRSMSQMISAHNSQSSFLSTVADKHNKSNLNIKSHLYPLWMDSLIEAAKLSDPLFDIDTEELWRKVMQAGIEHMIARY